MDLSGNSLSEILELELSNHPEDHILASINEDNEIDISSGYGDLSEDSWFDGEDNFSMVSGFEDLEEDNKFDEEMPACGFEDPEELQEEEKEEWRKMPDIHGFLDYEASSLGRLRRISTGRYQSDALEPNGYVRDSIYHIIDGRVAKSRHVLVALAFIPNPDNKPEVDHIDSNKSNNHASNLQWVTKKENNAKRIHVVDPRVRMVKVQQLNPKTKEVIKLWNSVAEANKAHGTSHISRACKSGEILGGFRWRHYDPDLPGETWKEYMCVEHTLLVSNMGRMVEVPKGHKRFGSPEGNYLITIVDKIRYPMHDLVCTVYHGVKPTPKHTANHKDHNPHNNKPENLEWATQGEQNKHRRKGLNGYTGLWKSICKIDKNNDTVLAVYESVKDAAAKNGISPCTITNAIKQRDGNTNVGKFARTDPKNPPTIGRKYKQ